MHRLTSLVCAGLLLSPSLSVRADVTPVSHQGPLGLAIQTEVESRHGHDSNLLWQRESHQAIDSDFIGIAPEFRMVGERGLDRYQLSYQGDYRRYDGSRADDYADHQLQLDGSWRFSLRNAFQLMYQYRLGHEARGEGLTEGFLLQGDEGDATFGWFNIAEPLRFRRTELGGRYSYGAPEARGKLELAWSRKAMRYADKHHYLNGFERYVTEQEWQENTAIAELFDQVSHVSRFRYTLQANLRRYPANPNKDSDEFFLITGVMSQLTGKTRIDANIGGIYKRFINDPQAESFRGLNWDLRLGWQPLDYSNFALISSRTIRDPGGDGGYVSSQQYGAEWQHYWSARVATTLSYHDIRDDYHQSVVCGQDPRHRQDEIHRWGMGLSYDLRPSINLGLSYQLADATSSFSGQPIEIGSGSGSACYGRALGYDKQQLSLSLKVAI
ncbi:outer membrane beta-barrel protein [Aeromonas hydrophila]|uniref:outer membrane beta-barrel protein n=1 Tax=Aeromonas hydrophila TaxID=644 RepID=UPI00209C73CF|nr:outer membrane beta-barrel protein [Aeromonas hydrophila]MCP1295635.1 outer membrane beta-barrel protein [Aeromonas hydrophila]